MCVLNMGSLSQTSFTLETFQPMHICSQEVPTECQPDTGLLFAPDTCKESANEIAWGGSNSFWSGSVL